MQLIFLQSTLTDYTLSKVKNFPLLIRRPEDPVFCLLPKIITLKKSKILSELQTSYPFIVWVFPITHFSSFFLTKKILFKLQPLYFIKKTSKNSFTVYDNRYLKTELGSYSLPSIQADLSICFLKTKELQKKENILFEGERNISFYFKGDTSDRLSYPPYLKALETRQSIPPKTLKPSTYLFLKKLLDVK